MVMIIYKFDTTLHQPQQFAYENVLKMSVLGRCARWSHWLSR